MNLNQNAEDICNESFESIEHHIEDDEFMEKDSHACTALHDCARYFANTKNSMSTDEDGAIFINGILHDRFGRCMRFRSRQHSRS